MTSTNSPYSQPIRGDEVYRLDQFERAVGQGKTGRRAAQKQGLPVRYFGRSGYILGEDWIAFLKQHGRNRRAHD